MTGAAILNETVTLQRVTITRDGFGEAVETWNTLAVRRAQRLDISDAEAIRASEVGAQLTTRFMIRHSTEVATLNARDRLMLGSEVYNIVGVKEKTRNRWIEISAARRSDIAASGA
jgi:SPP1 family predicted phage head-tail adaptor